MADRIGPALPGVNRAPDPPPERPIEATQHARSRQGGETGPAAARIAGGRRQARLAVGGVMKCHVLSCDVMFRRRSAPLRRPCRSAASLHPACRSSIAFRSVRAASGFRAAPPFFARIAWAHAPAFAPARFARLIARARAKRRAHFSCPFQWEFFAPARSGRRSALRMPLPPVSSYRGFHRVKPLPGLISNYTNKSRLPPRRPHARQHRPCIRVVAPDPDPGPSPSRFGLPGRSEDSPLGRGDGCACVRNPTRPVSRRLREEIPEHVIKCHVSS